MPQLLEAWLVEPLAQLAEEFDHLVGRPRNRKLRDQCTDAGIALYRRAINVTHGEVLGKVGPAPRRKSLIRHPYAERQGRTKRLASINEERWDSVDFSRPQLLLPPEHTDIIGELAPVVSRSANWRRCDARSRRTTCGR